MPDYKRQLFAAARKTCFLALSSLSLCSCGGSSLVSPAKNSSIMDTTFQLPARPGEKPATTPSNPHTQLNQQSGDRAIIESVTLWAFTTLPKAEEQPTRISVLGARAICLKREFPIVNQNAFMADREFAHFHPGSDGSMHLGLPMADAGEVIEKGWGELHPVVRKGWLPANFVMVYAPRNEAEAEVLKKIIYRSYQFATGEISGN
ncbi:MAG: phospholipase [Bacteroidetes bacterium]|nr:phospholipase [Bacteroidota bacterium]